MRAPPATSMTAMMTQMASVLRKTAAMAKYPDTIRMLRISDDRNPISECSSDWRKAEPTNTMDIMGRRAARQRRQTVMLSRRYDMSSDAVNMHAIG